MLNNALFYINNLIRITKDFLEKNISVEDFIINYEDNLVNNMDLINEFNSEIYEYLAEIQEAIAYYEPDPEIRDHPSYIDENELRRRTQANLEKISNLI